MLLHQRKEFGLAELIGTLDVEEKARAKDTHEKGVESSSVNVVQNKKQYAFRNKKKNKQENSKGQIRSQSKQQLLRRKRQMEVALFAVAMTIGQVLVQTANSNEKRKSQ